jgi:hypothetical protein
VGLCLLFEDDYLSLGCGAEGALRENLNLNEAIELEEVKAQVNFRRISDIEAAQLGLKGSPSVLINGKEIQPTDVQGFS